MLFKNFFLMNLLSLIIIKVQESQITLIATQTLDVLIFQEKVLSDVRSKIHLLLWRDIISTGQSVWA